MTGSELSNKTHGQAWLSSSPEDRLGNLRGMMDGLNQGLRFCASEVAFALSTRLSRDLSPESRLTVDSMIQQMRTWSKSGIVNFKYSRPIEDYASCLCEFYANYPKYSYLPPSYLLIYMDDKHGMGPAELFSLHEHSLQGFKH